MADEQAASLVSQNITALCTCPSGSLEFAGAIRTLNEISADLARDATLRQVVGRSPWVWEKLCEMWRVLTKRDTDVLVDDPMQREQTVCVSRLTRNLIAGTSANQIEAFKFEPRIREVAHMYTSHGFLTDQNEFVATRFLMQTISNLVTSNEELVQKLWSTYMSLAEEKNILIRMIAHPDDLTVIPALILIINSTVGNHGRMRVESSVLSRMLVDTSIGRRLCVALLDRLARYVETSDDIETADMFRLGWTIFKTLFDNGFALSLLSVTTMTGEVVNPHQTTLLKLLDSYLVQSSTPNSLGGKNEECAENCAISSQVTPILSAKLLELVQYAQSSIRHSLRQSNMDGTALNVDTGSIASNAFTEVTDVGATSQLQNLDVLLPKVCEALVLAAQCFCTMTLGQDARGDLSEEARWTRQFLADASSSDDMGLIENLIELLRLLDAFLPRLMFGRASWSTPRPETPSPQIDKKEDRGFTYLKRDLVRLVGILCYENRAVQDRVRACGGIPVVMNLCVTDERNPYLREHALFTLRNLLHENVDNQAVVDAIKPMGTWDDNGVLRDGSGVRK